MLEPAWWCPVGAHPRTWLAGEMWVFSVQDCNFIQIVESKLDQISAKFIFFVTVTAPSSKTREGRQRARWELVSSRQNGGCGHISHFRSSRKQGEGALALCIECRA